ncbi:TonB-dependent receptor plug domain-containing protein [Spirosoma taeanense]|uniref:TonB-dependent receptor plug domain-containing protein n=1 Tax=Spirosoma taeanense TaxID=2735870 RepID=A0A6M5Y4N4_9BACT|nr:TonB-dependent receptor plug domain-containing protein [Spirosoma taeanense]
MATLTGRVSDAKTGQPLPFASIYINNSSRGTVADSNGAYHLTNVPLGNAELVGSALGYQLLRQPLRLTDTRPRTVDLKLESADQALSTVIVTARRSPAYARQLRTFNRELLGNRPQARQCRIVNPNVISFQEEKGHLRAQAAEPLVIENRALGYRLSYNLLHFDFFQSKLLFAGTARFEEIPSTDPHQQALWQANRQKVYQGSLQHLMANLMAGTHEQAGYSVYRTPLSGESNNQVFPLVRTAERQYIGSGQAQALFRPGELPSERRLISDQPLEVYYNQVYAANSPYRDSPYAYSLLLLPKGRLELTVNGGITQSNGLDVRGYLGSERLATLLPGDWVPSQEESLVPINITAGRPLKPDAGLDSLVALRRRQYEQTAPIVYVQTDKTLYATGDGLWLSAYVLDAARQLPLVSRAETALHVELIAPSGRSVLHQWLRLTNGRAAASIHLADTLTAGTYRLRAYTAMDQIASSPAFECSFPVHNLKQPAPGSPTSRDVTTPPGTTDLAQHPLADTLDLQFLPEGGRWLAGIPGRLGIKVLQADGRGRLVSGRIVDQAGAEVGRFRTNVLGMGQVTFIPQAGQRYTAFMDGAAGSAARPVVLPAVEPEGWSLKADALSDSSRLLVSVRATGRYSQQPVYVTLQSREQLVYRQKWLLLQGEAHFALSTATLPPGVCRLTLWDMTNQPRAERLVYVPEGAGSIQMQVITGKPRYEAREQVVIGLQLRDAQGYPVTGSWSAAVTDADQLPADTSGADLRTYLLLTGGLRGVVESPAYYLEPEHRADVDNLLLTQGWRRLPAPQPLDSTEGWSLSGRVRDERGRALAGKPVLISLEQGGQRILRRVNTDAQGAFRLGELSIADTVQVQAGVRDPGPGGAVVSFDAPGMRFPSPAVAPPDWGALSASLASIRARQTAWPAYYRDSTARQLAEVIVRAAKPKPERPKDIQQASLHGAADGVLVVDRNVANSVIKVDQLIMRLPGVSVIGGMVTIGGISSLGNNTPLYLIDGMPADKDMLDALNPLEVSRIELLKSATTAGMYGARGGAGVIAIYTTKGIVEPFTSPSSVSATVFGFATPREFYVPRYAPSTTQSVNDRRDVLFWEPLGQNDADGQARLLFPLSDTAKRLRLVVQGLTSEGLPMSFTWVLPVR